MIPILLLTAPALLVFFSLSRSEILAINFLGALFGSSAANDHIHVCSLSLSLSFGASFAEIYIVPLFLQLPIESSCSSLVLLPFGLSLFLGPFIRFSALHPLSRDVYSALPDPPFF